MSLGRSRFSHIKTVRMLPSALDTSIRSVPEGPNAQREPALSHSREKYDSVKRCAKQAVYQHQSSRACWSPSRWPDLLGSPGWCPPQPEIKRGQQRCEFVNIRWLFLVFLLEFSHPWCHFPAIYSKWLTLIRDCLQPSAFLKKVL